MGILEKSPPTGEKCMGKWGILHKSPCTGETSMANWKKDIFYTQVCAQGKSQWETGKMTHFMEKSTHRGRVNEKLGKQCILHKSPCTGEKLMGKWETNMFYGKVHPQGQKSMGNWDNGMFYREGHAQGKHQWGTVKMVYFTQKSMHRGKVDGRLGKWHILHKCPCTGERSMGNWETYFMESPPTGERSMGK
jgi:hypothetical protein